MTRLCYVFLKPLRAEHAGFATHVPVRMSELLGEAGRVHVLYTGHLDEERLERAGVRTHAYGAGGSGSRLRRWVDVRSSVARVGADHAIDVFQNVWAHYALLPVLLGARSCGAAVVARVVGIPIGGASAGSAPRPIRRRLGLALERLVLGRVDAVHLVSESLASAYEARGVSRSRMAVISQGCDVDLFSPPPEGAGEPGQPLLLYVGRLDPWKEIGTLLHALRAVRDLGRPMRGLVVGEGPMRTELRTLADELGLSDSVRFPGEIAQDRLPEVMRSATAVVLPSRTEGLPNVVMESLACGTPVIATGVGAIPELLSTGGGWIVPPDSPERIAELAVRLADDPALRREAGRRGRAHVVRHHSFDVVRRAYLRLFEDVAAGRRREWSS